MNLPTVLQLRGRLLLLAAAFFLATANSSPVSAQPVSYPLPIPSRPTEEGQVVGWGSIRFGSNDCNLGYVSVAGGTFHSLALKEDGSIVAWGKNTYGEATIAEPNSNWTSIDAGSQFSVGLKSDGSIRVWGYGLDGQLTVPSPNSEFVGVAAGTRHVLGLKQNGQVVGWGLNNRGQTSVPSPNSDFVQIAAGYSHSVGLKSNGSIVTWGADPGGTHLPQPNSGFMAVAAGEYHSLGLKQDGSIVAWGKDFDFAPFYLPDPNTGFIAIAAQGMRSMALKSDGTVIVWAPNFQLAVAGDFALVDAGENHQLAVRSDGSIATWGDNSKLQRDILYSDARFVGIAGGSERGMLLRSDGSIRSLALASPAPYPNSDFVGVGLFGEPPSHITYQWGLRSSGELHRWIGTSFYGPWMGYVAMSGGAMALKIAGSIDCLIGSCFGIPDPNENFIAIASGNSYGLGLKIDGSLVSWGSTAFRQVPTPNSGYIAISGGATHWLGLKNDGSVVGWPLSAPGAQVPAPNSNFVAIAAGTNHSIGLKSNGAIVAWGNNSQALNIPMPNSDFIAVSAEQNSCLAIRRVVDCNNNGRSDSCDIEAAGLPDLDGDQILDECQPPFALDIRPNACPNVLNNRGRYKVQVAIVGTRRAPISQIDVDSLSLQRADGKGEPLQPDLGFRQSNVTVVDLATPESPSDCACNRLGADGVDDLLIEFSSRDFFRKLDLDDISSATLTLAGLMLDGTPIEITDCIRIAGDSSGSRK